jgi:poly-gamma-glutamate synthesis protein (capsule biosynthesis protein)
MTGTTALVRAVGYKQETKGMEYPGEDIRSWLRDADFTHISSESSFNPACPPANPTSKSFMFCSRPEYVQLFDSVGVNIVELSGNHNNDWGRDAFLYSLNLFRQRGWKWFAGGENAQAAMQPLLIEHNGNRIALIGCNYAGPPGVWATADEPGAAHCNLDWLDQELARLRGDGYLPVMTFQYNEIYQMKPSEGQMRDFRRASDAGAVIVSGSQAHFPQLYEFRNGAFIHYGLGNLFFDQMDTPVDGTRRELLDLHVFYDGKHISTVVLTAVLEDYARPRPMTGEERAQFLQELFSAAGW